MATTELKDLEIAKGGLVKKVGDKLYRYFAESSTDEVLLIGEDGTETTLTATLNSIATLIATMDSSTSVDSKISTAIGALVNGAAEEGDTLSELLALIVNNKDAMAVLTEAIGAKVSKEDGKSLVSDDLIAIVSTITTAKIEQWDAAEKNAINSMSANGVALDITNGNVDITVPAVTMSSSLPDSTAPDGLYFITK